MPRRVLFVVVHSHQPGQEATQEQDQKSSWQSSRPEEWAYPPRTLRMDRMPFIDRSECTPAGCLPSLPSSSPPPPPCSELRRDRYREPVPSAASRSPLVFTAPTACRSANNAKSCRIYKHTSEVKAQRLDQLQNSFESMTCLRWWHEDARRNDHVATRLGFGVLRNLHLKSQTPTEPKK